MKMKRRFLTAPCAAIFTQVPALKWSKVLRERWTAEEPGLGITAGIGMLRLHLKFPCKAEEILGHMLQPATPAGSTFETSLLPFPS